MKVFNLLDFYVFINSEDRSSQSWEEQEEYLVENNFLMNYYSKFLLEEFCLVKVCEIFFKDFKLELDRHGKIARNKQYQIIDSISGFEIKGSFKNYSFQKPKTMNDFIILCELNKLKLEFSDNYHYINELKTIYKFLNVGINEKDS